LVHGWLIVDCETFRIATEEQETMLEEETDSDNEIENGENSGNTVDISGTSKEKTVKWVQRKIKDCQKELSELSTCMLEELKNREDQCLPKLMYLLYRCLDFGNHFINAGCEDFHRCVGYVARLPHIIAIKESQDLEIDPEFSEIFFWRMKKVILNTIWGELFPSLFVTFFGKINSASEKLETISINYNVTVISFQKLLEKFDLLDKYKVELSDGSCLDVVFQEDKFIEALYTNAELYAQVGKEFCTIFDIFYAKTGTESVVESFYRVVESQEQDGGQKTETLAGRAKVDWCFRSVLHCDSVLDEMADLYIQGDTKQKLKHHNVPVYRDARSIRLQNGYSKVLNRIASSPNPFPFLS
jgi:hypothetical protein